LIPVTLFDGQACWLNPDHIIMIEARPDTIIRLSTGEKWLVQESVEELRIRFTTYKQQCHTALPVQQNDVDSTTR
jgi:flagellar protein FlbD